jgi:tetratricopeptide (TPR) repeat protein
MLIRDYKGKDTYKTLGLKRGKAAIKHRTSSKKTVKVCVWAGLFALVAIVNYFVFVHLGPFDKTEITIGPILRENRKPLTFEEWFDKGNKLSEDGDLAGAVHAYTKAIALSPENTRTYFNRGAVYITLGEYEKAVEDFNTVISRQGDYAEAYYNRGQAYFRSGLYDHAIQDCGQALLLDSQLAPAHVIRGMAYQAKGSVDSAKRDFHKGCELGDDDACRAYQQMANGTGAAP